MAWIELGSRHGELTESTRANVLLAVAVVRAFVAGSNGWAVEKTAKLTPVRIALVSRSTWNLPFWWRARLVRGCAEATFVEEIAHLL